MAGVTQGSLISHVVFSLCQRHALSLAPRRFGPVRGKHNYHSHVPQTDAARQLPEFITQIPTTVVG